MGNEVQNLRKDLIDLDIEEIKINRELYNLQMQINAQLSNAKKIKIKNNYKQIAEKKLLYLENKKRLLFEDKNNLNIIGQNLANNQNKMIDTEFETGEHEDIKNNKEDNKLNLVSNNSSKGKKFIVDKIETNKDINKDINNNNIENINDKKEKINDLEKQNETKITKKNNKTKLKEIKKDSNNNNNKNNKINDENKNDGINNDNENNKKINNNNDEIEENLNINEYKRFFFDRLSSLGSKPNINKSMDNKNSSIDEELEIVGLSQNGFLKDKLSDYLVGSSVESSSNDNRNNSSMYNNYYKNRPKSGIQGVNRQLISTNKKNDENKEFIISTNDSNKRNLNYEENEDKDEENKKRDDNLQGQVETEESINNKDTGINTVEKSKEKNKMNITNERRLLKNNRNKSFYFLEDSSMQENTINKESE